MSEIIHQLLRCEKKYNAARKCGRPLGKRFRVELDALRADWEDSL